MRDDINAHPTPRKNGGNLLPAILKIGGTRDGNSKGKKKPCNTTATVFSCRPVLFLASPVLSSGFLGEHRIYKYSQKMLLENALALGCMCILVNVHVHVSLVILCGPRDIKT